ncbi:MAG: hypothetical protein J6Q54_02260, partial [Oscillospiraceae bacterium]|nr:hypothetical protein [Oscillospiraceae bacterium]
MKRCVSILTLILAIIFTGCTQSTTPDVTQNPTFPTESVEDVTTAPPEETTDIEDMLLHPLYSISLYDTEEITESGNGSEVFKFVHQNIVLILPEPEISNKIIIDFVNEENAIATHAEAAAQDALQAYADGELTTPHLLQSKYSAYRLDESVLSLYGEAVSFTGGAHSVYTGQSLNYDTLTGKRLSLSDVFNETFTVEIMREMIQHQLNVFYKDLLFEGYETLLTSFVPDDLSECTN